MSNRPAATEYAPYYGRYINLVSEEKIIDVLENQSQATAALLKTINEQQAESRYAPDKWSVKQLIGHVVDAERVFAYRALCIARGDKTALPSFDQNAYAAAADVASRSMRDVAEEYAAVRRATTLLFRGFSEGAWKQSGTASDNPVSVRALAYIIAGHERHHLRVLRDSYRIG